MPKGLSYLLSLLLLGLPIAPLVAEESLLSPKLQEAIVYADQAMLLSTGKVRLKPGAAAFVVANIPQTLDEQSIRLNILGGQAKINDIRVKTDYVTRYLDEKRRNIDSEIEKLQADQQRLQRRLRTLYQQYQALAEVSVTAPKGSAGEPRWPLNTAKWPQLVRFLENNLSQLLEERASILNRLRKTREELQRRRAEQQEEAGKKITAAKAIAFVLEAETAKLVTYKLSYVVSGASWHPVYDLRVDSGLGRANLTASAWVTQTTGYDWENIDVTVSSAIPSFDINLPEWRSTIISEATPRQSQATLKQRKNIAADRKQVRGKRRRTATKSEAYRSLKEADQLRDMPKRRASAPMPREERALASLGKDMAGVSPPSWWLQDRLAAFVLPKPASRSIAAPSLSVDRYPPNQSANGFDYRYKALRKETVVSKSAGQRLPIGSFALPIDLYRRVHPSVSKYAYLEGKINNTTKQPLLAGSVYLYLDGSYVGRKALPTLPKRSYGRVPLGVDRQIKVSRVHKRDRQDRGLIFTDHETKHTVDTQIINLRQQSVTLRVVEQLPRSVDQQQVIVTLDEVKPDLTGPLKEGRTKLEWQLSIPAKKERLVSFSYLIRHRANLYVNHEAIP